MDDLTADEERAIASLNRLAKKWPKSLWLFSNSGSLEVHKCRADGTKAINGDHFEEGSYVKTIHGISNDGGDCHVE